MKVLNNLSEIQNVLGMEPDIGLTIGNFDGVHIGHRQLLQKISTDCVSKKLKFTLVTFLPHPQKILQPEKSHLLINTYEDRRKLLEEMGVDILIELKFTRDQAKCLVEQFQFYIGEDE